MVLHRSDSTSSGPIDRSGEGASIGRGIVNAVSRRGGVLAVKTKSDFDFPLIQREVRKLVVAEFVRQVLVVSLFNEIVIVGEILKMVNEAFAGGNFELVFSEPIEKFALCKDDSDQKSN